MFPSNSADSSLRDKNCDRTVNKEIERGWAMKQNLLLVGCLCVQFHGATELHDAAITGDIKKAQEFIDRYPGLINAPDVAYGGWPALFYAAYFGDEQMTHMLVQRGANTYLTDIMGKTASDYARLQGHHIIVAFLYSVQPEHKIK